MICISVGQSSHTFTLVDMLNAAPQCDLVEVRLDRFGRTPDVAAILAARKKPVIMACRRVEDGGDWGGSEADRLELLRRCAAQQADFVEVELDVADRVPVTPPTKKIVAYTSTLETPDDLADLYARAVALKPDVIKLAMPARTPEEAWPLVQILAKPAVPTVVLGLGKTGVMLSILARRVGAPWVYASLERGLEADYGLATIGDLDQVYHYRDIGKGTRFVGVTGFGDVPRVRIGLLNAACQAAGQPLRCLPLAVGEVPLLAKVLDVIKAAHLVVAPEHQRLIQPLAAEVDGLARESGIVDWLQLKGAGWQGFNLRALSALASMQAATPDKSLKGRTVLFAGVNDLARALAGRVRQAGGKAVVCCANPELGEAIAGQWSVDVVPPGAVAEREHDFLVVCGEAENLEGLRKDATVLDLTAGLETTPLLRRAAELGCKVLGPRRLFLDEVGRQAKLLTGQDAPTDQLAELFYALVEE